MRPRIGSIQVRQDFSFPESIVKELFHKLKLSSLLSFGPDWIDLPMERSNVLVGPSGSGKSNLLEAMSLLQVA